MSCGSELLPKFRIFFDAPLLSTGLEGRWPQPARTSAPTNKVARRFNIDGDGYNTTGLERFFKARFSSFGHSEGREESGVTLLARSNWILFCAQDDQLF